MDERKQIVHQLNEIDKKLLCKRCARMVGRPYFSYEDLYEMGIYD